MSYEPKVEVVRASPMGRGCWNAEDGKWFDMERAYLVRGLPMPGERVVVLDPHASHDRIETVRNLWVGIDTCSGAGYHVESLRPYDPEAERLRVATEAVRNRCERRDCPSHEDLARAVLDAIKEVDDG